METSACGAQAGRPIERAGSHGRSLERLGSQVRAAAARGGEDGAQVGASGPPRQGRLRGPGRWGAGGLASTCMSCLQCA